MGVWSDMPSWQVIGILGEEGDASAMRPARKDGDRVPRWARTGTDYAACLDRAGLWPHCPWAAVIDGEAIGVARGRPTFARCGRGRGQAGTILIGRP
jgi:hypothetical protein